MRSFNAAGIGTVITALIFIEGQVSDADAARLENVAEQHLTSPVSKDSWLF